MGTRHRNCVGRCSQVRSDDEYYTDFPYEQFAVGYIHQQCCSSNSFVAMVLLFRKLERIRPCQLEMERARMMTGCKSTLSRTNQKPERKSQDQRDQHELWGEGLLETRCRSVRQFHGNKATRRKARVTRKAKETAITWTLWKRISLQKQLQPCRILHKHRVQVENSRAIQSWNRGSWV